MPAAASLDVPGITPIITPNDEFYKIDTTLVSPRVDVATGRSRCGGMVDREVTLTYDDLAAMPLFEQYVTISCVSNEVGGRLVGNALWTGVDLREVLDMAGVQPDADADRQPFGRWLVVRLPHRLGHGSRPSTHDRAGHERVTPARSTMAIRPASSSRACMATSAPPSGSARSS